MTMEGRSEFMKIKEIRTKLGEIFGDNKSLTRAVIEGIYKNCDEYEVILTNLLLDNERLKGRLDELKALGPVSRIPVSRQLGAPSPAVAKKVAGPAMDAPVHSPEKEESWSRVVGRGQRMRAGRAQAAAAVNGARPVPTPRPLCPESFVVIKPLDGVMTGKEVRERLVSIVGKNLKLKVEGIKDIKSGGVLVRTADEQEAKKLKESGLVKEAGLGAEKMKEPGNKLLVYDVEESVSDEELVTEIVGRNLENAEEGTVGEIKVISKKKYGRIIEVNDIVRSTLLKAGRIYVRWSSLRVRDFAFVDRCYGCHAFGHMAKACPLKVPLCSVCCEPGHRAADCPSGKDVCRNCRRAGLESGHSVFSIECPSYKNKLNAALNRTRKW